ncbi:MAG: magnesium transporter CorA family protein [Candidatus Nanopelagicales bacterium]
MGRTETQQVVRTRVYRAGHLEKEDFPVEELSEYLAQPDTVLWVDLCAPDHADMELISEELSLHALAVEDAVDIRQRPKLDRYETHEFLNMYAVRLDPISGDLALSELAAFVTKRVLVTVRKDSSFDMDAVVAQWDGSPDLAVHGVGFLLYGLIDHVVDGHFDAVETFDEQIEQLEDLLFDDNPRDQDVQRRSFALRKSLVTFRRVVLPMREVVNTLMRRDGDNISAEMMPYFQDVYDHVLRATEWTESLRDLVTTIVETNLTLQGNRLNVITKKVTSWAAIIAVPTAITGFYGQNLPYPGFADTAGLITSSLLIVVISGVLYLTFKRKDWL